MSKPFDHAAAEAATDKETADKIASMCKAHHEGEYAARALKVGDMFMGAMPEAIRAGYAPDTAEYRAFLDGYVTVLEKRAALRTVEKMVNIITEIGEAD